MTLRMPSAILHATRLVRSGSLREATELIQRTLRNADPPPASEAANVDPTVIDGTFHRIDSEFAPAQGQFVTRSYSNAAGRRDYKIYIPAAYTRQPLPLVIMRHGCIMICVWNKAAC